MVQGCNKGLNRVFDQSAVAGCPRPDSRALWQRGVPVEQRSGRQADDGAGAALPLEAMVT
jgi:hypothetical protein